MSRIQEITNRLCASELLSNQEQLEVKGGRAKSISAIEAYTDEKRRPRPGGGVSTAKQESPFKMRLP